MSVKLALILFAMSPSFHEEATIIDDTFATAYECNSAYIASEFDLSKPANERFECRYINDKGEVQPRVQNTEPVRIIYPPNRREPDLIIRIESAPIMQDGVALENRPK